MVPLFKNSHQEAINRGFISEWHESDLANSECRDDIDAAISKGFSNNIFDDTCVDDVLDKHGFDRTMWVLAASINCKSYDGRFSVSNKKWASMYLPMYIPEADTLNYLSDKHPLLLNAFTDAVKERYSLLGLVGKDECLSEDERTWENKLLIINPAALNEENRQPINQYFVATHGVGCLVDAPSDRGVYGYFLSDNEPARFNKGEIIGVADPNKLPQWAIIKLKGLKKLDVVVETPTETCHCYIPIGELPKWLDAKKATGLLTQEAYLDSPVRTFNELQKSGGYGYSASAVGVTEKNPYAYDHTCAAINYAEYMLANADYPKQALEHISQKIYESDNELYGGIIYLTDIKSCEAAKQIKRKYLKSFMPQDIESEDVISEDKGR